MDIIDKSRFEALLTYKEVAYILSLSPQTLRKWVSSKRIPCIKLGTAVRFTRSQVNDLIGKSAKEEL